MKTKKHPCGRPSAYTREAFDRICERFSLGMSLQRACEAEATPGITLKSFEKHLKRHPEFVGAYKGAKAKYLDWAMQQLARNKDWRAIAWLLERRFPELFARPERPTVSVQQSNTNAPNVLPPDLVKRAREWYEQRNGKLD